MESVLLFYSTRDISVLFLYTQYTLFAVLQRIKIFAYYVKFVSSKSITSHRYAFHSFKSIIWRETEGRVGGYGQLSLYEYTSLLLSLQIAYKSCYLSNLLSIGEAWNFSSNWGCTENKGEILCGIDSLNPELVDSLWSNV